MSNTVISYSTEEFDNETAACKVAKDTALEHYFELVKTSEGNQSARYYAVVDGKPLNRKALASEIAVHLKLVANIA